MLGRSNRYKKFRKFDVLMDNLSMKHFGAFEIYVFSQGTFIDGLYGILSVTITKDVDYESDALKSTHGIGACVRCCLFLFCWPWPCRWRSKVRG